jgi:hypothetical protein
MARETRERETRRERNESYENFTDQRIFDPPTPAIVRGRMVKVRALGNHEGHSPAYLCWDEQGQSTIESIDEVTMVDINSLPPSTEQVAELFRSLKR